MRAAATHHAGRRLAPRARARAAVPAPSIELPNQDADYISHIAVDIGGTLVKLVYFSPDPPLEQNPAAAAGAAAHARVTAAVSAVSAARSPEPSSSGAPPRAQHAGVPGGNGNGNGNSIARGGACAHGRACVRMGACAVIVAACGHVLPRAARAPQPRHMRCRTLCQLSVRAMRARPGQLGAVWQPRMHLGTAQAARAPMPPACCRVCVAGPPAASPACVLLCACTCTITLAARVRAGRLHFVKFETSRVEDAIQFIEAKGLHRCKGRSGHMRVKATGGRGRLGLRECSKGTCA